MKYVTPYADFLAEKSYKPSNTRLVMYHGTGTNNLDSILLHGLVMDPENRAWSTEYEQTGRFSHRAWSSMPGIYLTADPITAMYFGSESPNSDTFGYDHRFVLVIVTMEARDLVLDEDDERFPTFVIPNFKHRGIKREPGESLITPAYEPQVYMLWCLMHQTDPESKKILSDWRNYYVRVYMDLYKKYVFGKEVPRGLADRLRKLLHEGFDKAVVRNAAYLNPKDPDTYYETDRLNITRIEDFPNKSTSEREFSIWLEKWTAAQKSLVYNKAKYGNPTEDNLKGRYRSSIGFTGANRITGIIEVTAQYKPFEGLRMEKEIKIHYGEIPDHFFETIALERANGHRKEYFKIENVTHNKP